MHAITLALFTTSNSVASPMLPKVRGGYLAMARKLLEPHKISIDTFDTTATADGDAAAAADGCRVLPYNGSIKLEAGRAGGESDCNTLRRLCHAAVPNGRGIPVIFGMFYDQNIYGVMVPPGSEMDPGAGWLPYILINLRAQAKFNGVLLHELIHAAYANAAAYPGGVGHDKGKANERSIFAPCAPDERAENPVQQDQLAAKHVAALRNAYFTS